MTDLISDVSVLTDVPEATLRKFVPIVSYVISHSVHETQCEGKDLAEIDLGFGQLILKIDENSLRYRFVPSKELEKQLISAVTSGYSPLTAKITSNLQEKIESAFKELV